MPSLIIGLVGTPGSGKGTVAKILQQTYGATLFRFSTVLEDILKRLALEKTRANMIQLSEALRGSFGEDVLAHAIHHETLSATTDLVVIDGIRRIGDLTLLLPLTQFKLIAVSALPEIRYARMKQRGEKIGESEMSREKFESQERASTEITIPEAMKLAWKTIENTGTIEALEEQIATLMKELKNI
jgi:dephospho-CoA kinase